MKITSSRSHLIVGLAALVLFTLCVFQPPALTALATTTNATAAPGDRSLVLDRGEMPPGLVSEQTPTNGDPDRPVILGQTPNSQADKAKVTRAHPELTIKQFLFPPANDKALRVQVANTGRAASGQIHVYLGTGEANNPEGRYRTTALAAQILAAGASVWLVIDASSILPKNASLQSTNFKCNVYSTEILAESGKTEVRHAQLEFTAATPTSTQRRRIIEGYSAEFYAGGRLESGNPQKLKTKETQNSADSFYSSGVYKSTDGGRTWQVVGTCNTARGCVALKDACKSLKGHSFKATGADGSLGMCSTATFYLRNSNSAGSGHKQPPPKPTADLSLAAPKKTSEATLNCHGAVFCKKVKNICAALGGTYTPVYDLAGSCRY